MFQRLPVAPQVARSCLLAQSPLPAVRPLHLAPGVEETRVRYLNEWTNKRLPRMAPLYLTDSGQLAMSLTTSQWSLQLINLVLAAGKQLGITQVFRPAPPLMVKKEEEDDAEKPEGSLGRVASRR